MTSEQFRATLKRWSLTLTGPSLGTYDLYRMPSGITVSVKKPEGLTAAQRVSVLKDLARTYGFE